MTTLREIFEAQLRSIEARDATAAAAWFATDGILIDPHYPLSPLDGPAMIAEGFQWVLSIMDSMTFRTTGFFFSEDGLSGAAEVESSHVLKGGHELNFSQAFVIESRAGLLTRVQAYEPYGPGGIGGFFLRLQGRKFRKTHRR